MDDDWYWPYAGLSPAAIEERIADWKLLVQEADDKLDTLRGFLTDIEGHKADLEANIEAAERNLERLARRNEERAELHEPEPVEGDPIRVRKNPGMPDEYMVLRWPDGREELV